MCRWRPASRCSKSRDSVRSNRNLDLAYVDTGGGFGVVQARDADGGERAERALHRYIEPVGWTALVLLLAGVAALFVWKG